MKKVFMFMAIALMAVCMTACKSEGKNDPSNPEDKNEYYVYAGLVINPELEQYLSEVAVRYTIPGEGEKVEKLTFHALSSKDERAYASFSESYGYKAEECKVVVFKKTFTKSGAADINLDIKVDATKPVSGAMNILLIPEMDIKSGNVTKSSRKATYSGGVPQANFYEILLLRVEQIKDFWKNEDK